MDKENEFIKYEEVIEEDYPEAYIYYCMGKIFGWSPDIVDKLDIDLCRVLISIEKDVNERINEDIDNIGKKKIGSGIDKDKNKKNKNLFPEEWQNMSTKDIINSDKFKKIQEKEGQMFVAMQDKAGHMLGLK